MACKIDFILALVSFFWIGFNEGNSSAIQKYYLRSLWIYWLNSNIHVVSAGRCQRLRSTSDRTCAVPRTRNTFGDTSFAAAGRTLCHQLYENRMPATENLNAAEHILCNLMAALDVSEIILLWQQSLRCSLTWSLELPADGPQTAGLVKQRLQTVAKDMLFGQWNQNAVWIPT